MPAIRAVDSPSMTCSAHGSWPPSGAPGRYCPNAGAPLATVGTQAGAAAADPRAEHQPADVLVAPEPQLVRRHRLHRVLVQQRGERVHVVALEGVDVPAEQRLLLVVQRRRAGRRRDVGSRQRRPGPLQGAVDRGDRGVEQLGDLGRLPAQHLAQDQHRPLPRRQVLQRGDEREPDRLAGLGQLGRVAAGRQHAAVGDRQTHVASGQRSPSGSSAVAGGGELHRPGPALARSACRGTRSWRCGTATSAARTGPRSGRCPATRAPGSPAPRPRPRTPTRASGSSTRSARRRYCSRAASRPVSVTSVMRAAYPWVWILESWVRVMRLRPRRKSEFIAPSRATSRCTSALDLPFGLVGGGRGDGHGAATPFSRRAGTQDSRRPHARWP